MATWNTRGLRGSTLEDMVNRTNEKYLENGKESIDMCKAMEEWAEELREEGKSAGIKEGELRGMQKAKESTLKLVAKMSENGDTEYIARLMEPEVYRRMMDKYGME